MLSRLTFLRHGILAAALSILVPGAASAHAMLHSSDPADGATLNASPRTLNLAFTEDCRVTALRLLDESGREQQVRREGGRAASSQVTATLAGPLRPGGYRLEWRAMGDDGHVMSGAVRFAVNAAR
ncbi:copper resistance CopC family protein [Pseudoroseomonas ludipueritiae]|uniref:Copper resistance protein CopC n=1 Tax=Pseudoroseomonas ludipueritiae TaxID=198093 RepID=A0ABR7R2L3_9PROT|nr:copper resistance CopC family protein [Pseudoroseomonas ludipueritiae]MBC9175966.1 copper resistance protein CopC [Pseudoroseomonas ludipueritiae]